MGAMKNAKAEERGRKFKREFSNGQGVTDWETADAALLCRAIATVAATGGALRFGYTRDGGAYSVGIYGDGDPYTEYIRPSEDVDAFLRDIIESFT
jgi:hypothetical protein